MFERRVASTGRYTIRSRSQTIQAEANSCSYVLVTARDLRRLTFHLFCSQKLRSPAIFSLKISENGKFPTTRRLAALKFLSYPPESAESGNLFLIKSDLIFSKYLIKTSSANQLDFTTKS